MPWPDALFLLAALSTRVKPTIMPTRDQFSDDYVAELLAKDAKKSTAKYSSYGLQDILPRRSALASLVRLC